MDPRIHARLLAVRRQATRRRRRFLALVAGLATVLAALVAASRTPLLAVHHVRVSGGAHTARASVLAATGLGRGPLMVDVNAARLRGELLALPWVATARVSRHWPATVDIRLTERTPVASVPGPGGSSALVDGTGRVLTVGAPGAPAGAPLPTITGLQPAGAPGSTVQPAAQAAGALLVATSLPRAVDPPPGGVVRAIVVQGSAVQLALSNGPSVILGTADQLAQKLSALRTVLQRVDLHGVATIDLRVPDEAVLTHAPQGTTVSTTSRG